MNDISSIKTRLNKWCEVRCLTHDKQRDGIHSNLLEELTEFTRSNSDYGRLDAICDIVVFSLNAISLSAEKINDIFNILKPTEYPKEFLSIEFMQKMLSYIRDIILNKNDINRIETLLIDIVCLCYSICKTMGYDFFIAMDETIKEIESRQGEWNDNIKKFVKYDGAYSKDEAEEIMNRFATHEDKNFWYFNKDRVCKWYSADYSKSKAKK